MRGATSLGSDMGDNPHDDDPHKPPVWAVRFSATMAALNPGVLIMLRWLTRIAWLAAPLIAVLHAGASVQWWDYNVYYSATVERSHSPAI
jgi:hypothetical protein